MGNGCNINDVIQENMGNMREDFNVGVQFFFEKPICS